MGLGLYVIYLCSTSLAYAVANQTTPHSWQPDHPHSGLMEEGQGEKAANGARQ